MIRGKPTVVLLAVFLLLLGTFAYALAAPTAPTTLTGRVKQRDATPLHSDRLIIQLNGVREPSFGALRGYLVKDDGQSVTAIGELPVVNGSISTTWDSPSQENLIGNYSTFRVTREEIYAQAALPAGALKHIRHVVYRRSETPGNVGYAVGLVQQAQALLTHANNAKTWADQGNLAEAKRHTEHVINILVGEDSPLFRDWNGDGLTQNPGDGFGILPGTEDRNGDGRINVGYARGTHDHIQNAANSPDATDNIKTRAEQVKAAIYNIMGSRDRLAFPHWAAALLYQAMIIESSDSITTVQQAAAQMARLADLILNGQDLNNNGKVEPILGEGGAWTAYLYAQHAADYYPSEVTTMRPTFLPFISRGSSTVTREVSYSRDVQPIFNAYCVSCHGDVGPEEGLSLTSYEGVMAGSVHGPVVIPGDPINSELVKRIKGISTPRMPFGGPPLSETQIHTIEMWVAQGAKDN